MVFECSRIFFRVSKFSEQNGRHSLNLYSQKCSDGAWTLLWPNSIKHFSVKEFKPWSDSYLPITMVKLQSSVNLCWKCLYSMVSFHSKLNYHNLLHTKLHLFFLGLLTVYFPIMHYLELLIVSFFHVIQISQSSKLRPIQGLQRSDLSNLISVLT